MRSTGSSFPRVAALLTGLMLFGASWAGGADLSETEVLQAAPPDFLHLPPEKDCWKLPPPGRKACERTWYEYQLGCQMRCSRKCIQAGVYNGACAAECIEDCLLQGYSTPPPQESLLLDCTPLQELASRIGRATSFEVCGMDCKLESKGLVYRGEKMVCSVNPVAKDPLRRQCVTVTCTWRLP